MTKADKLAREQRIRDALTRALVSDTPKTRYQRNGKQLTEVEVREIRAERGKRSTKDLARKYGVSARNIRLLWSGKTWKNIQ